MKVSVNILTWNTLRTTIESLKILRDDLVGIEHEIIIVDNGSTDGCRKIATIKNEVNLGISKGKNQGIDASKGDYIFLIDGDIVPVHGSILRLIEHLDNNPDCDAIGFLPNKFTMEKNRNGAKNHEEYCHKLDPIEEHKGHCIYYGIYRRSVFERGVRFDENYGVGYGWEDIDTYKQMERLGIKQWVAGINHKCGKYYHAINSSVRSMGRDVFMKTEKERGEYFKNKWQEVQCVR